MVFLYCNMNILMATMALDIGGAETHIVELSKELRRRGHSVTVASNGGAFVPALEEAGIEHVGLPMNSKRPDKAFRAYLGICRLLKTGNFDLVHSHSRISSFICALACERYGVRFTTTCHGVYDMNFLWRRLSKWGINSLAVSCDTKAYLVREYGVPPDNIHLTINGIDTEKFSPLPLPAQISPGTGLAPGKAHRVIYCSRIDEASAHCAFMLVEKAPELARLYPDFELVIIGGGDSLERLKAEGERVNADARAESGIERDVVMITGSVTDVNVRLRSGIYKGDDGSFYTDSVFVGVSRAALEAMACGLPVILSGSQGYLGRFDTEMEHKALSTNLCGRGCRMPDAETLMRDVVGMFSLSDKERRELGRFGRDFVMRRFTVTRMADDAEKLYNGLRPFRPKKGRTDVILSGYYGFGNTGDDSLLYQITNSLKSLAPDLDITVLAHKPRRLRKLYAVKTVNRFNIIKINRVMSRAGLLINGGGSLLQNTTSQRSLIYYVKIIETAKKRGMRCMLYGSGLGPIHGEKAEQLTKTALDDMDAITLRDEGSLSLLRRLGVNETATAVTADPAFLLEPSDMSWLEYSLAEKGIADVGKTFAVALRGRIPGECDGDLIEKIIAAAAKIYETTGLTPVFIPLQLRQDLDVCRKAAEKIPGSILLDTLSPRDMRAYAGRCAFIISLRLHILIYGFAGGTPGIGLDCDPKLTALIRQTGTLDICPDFILPIIDFDPERLIKAAACAVENREIMSGILKKNADILRRRAKTDPALALEILYRPDPRLDYDGR
jgi:polysaccharide pyruvyl transferase CsaB